MSVSSATTGQPMVKAAGVHKASRAWGAERHRSGGAPRRGDVPARAFGLGQVDVPALHQPPGEDRLGATVGRRRAGRLSPGRRALCTSCAKPTCPQARGDRHGLPALQPVPAYDRAGERHVRADPRQGRVALARGRARQRAARPRRACGQGGRLSVAAVRRPAAARGDRPGAGDGAEADAVRRAHLGARSRARGRRAAGHAAAGT